MPKPLLLALLVANALVLLGELWPAGAPPFASAVVLVTLAANVVVFGLLLARGRGSAA